MPFTRTHRSILLSHNLVSVTKLSLAPASRIPVPQHAPVARVPTATSIPRPLNSLLVARRYIPTFQRVRPSTTAASLASSLAAMSISTPVNQAIAAPTATRPMLSLPCRKLAADRIRARQQKVTANLQAPRKRPTTPASIHQSSSMPSRAVPPTVNARVSILMNPVGKRRRRCRVIPRPSLNAPPSTPVSAEMTLTPREPRGEEAYCKGRPCTLDGNGNLRHADYQHDSFHGTMCTCHPAGGIIPTQYWVNPRRWKTTPAEADVDPTRRRIVRFAEDPVQETRTFSPWWQRAWSPFEYSSDDTTEAEDDAAIHAIDNPPPVSDFHRRWQAMMDEGFSDDDEYY